MVEVAAHNRRVPGSSPGVRTIYVGGGENGIRTRLWSWRSKIFASSSLVLQPNSLRGGTGRHEGLKIPWVWPVRVQISPERPI